MNEWIARYWFSLAGACVAIALGAYWLINRKARASNPVLSQAPSVWSSGLLAFALLALYVLGAGQTGQAELVFEATFFALVSLLFFAANKYANRIALFALICWLSTSSIRTSRALWTRVFGLLFLGGAVAVLVQLLQGG